MGECHPLDATTRATERRMIMNCPKCGSSDTYVLETRQTASGSMRRRRECSDCHNKFTKYEVNQKQWKVLSKIAEMMEEGEMDG